MTHSMRHRLKMSAIALAGGLVALFGTSPAKADFIYSLGAANPDLSGFPSPYGSVNVHLSDPTHATITFTRAITGGFAYFFTDGGSAGVNTNGAATLSGITGDALAGGPCPAGGNACYSNGGSGNEDGFGLFSNTVDTTDSFSNRSTTISFILTKTSGTWASDSTVLTNNSTGFLAAAHMGVCSATACTAFNSTGFVGNGTPNNNIPEPASLAIFGAALAGLGLIRRRRHNTV